MNRRQCVQVGNEIIGLFIVLQRDVLANRAEVIAPMEAAGRLDPGKDSQAANSF